MIRTLGTREIARDKNIHYYMERETNKLQLVGSSLLVTRLFQKNRSYFGEEMVLQLTLEIKELEAKIEKIKKEWHLY